MALFQIETPQGVFEVEAPEGTDPRQIAAMLGGQQDDWAERTKVDDRGLLSNLAIGMGRGFTDVGQGLQQWFRGDEYDKQVQEEAALYDRNMDSGAATLGRVAGNIAATAVPGGAAARGVAGARALANTGNMGRAIAAGAAGGATEGALLADTQGQGKLGQIGASAALGGAGGAAAETLLRGLGGIVNAPRRAVEGLMAPREGFAGRFAGTVDDAAEGARLAQSTGIDLSPAQRSGGKAATMAENLSRQSIFSIDEAFAADSVRANQMVNTVRNMARRIGPETDSISAAKSVQSTVDDMARSLARERSEFGRRAYGEVDRIAGNAPIVSMDNTIKALDDLIGEFDNTVGTDASNIVAQAKAFRQRIMDAQPKKKSPKINYTKGDRNPLTGQPWNAQPTGTPSMTASDAMRQLQVWSKAARGNGQIFDKVTPGQDRYAAGKLQEALMADLDATSAQGGTVGDLLRKANDGWRMHSDRIEALRRSLLGEVVGEEFADEINGVAFNRLAPEKVFDKLRNAPASQIQVAKQYLMEHNPEVWQKFQRSVLEEALLEAQASAPSLGANTLPVNPGAFVKALTGSSGRQSVKRTNQLKAIFGDTEMYPLLEDVLEAATRMADSTGRNFSGTAPANEAYGVFNTIMGGLKGAAKGTANIMGARQVARAMTPGAPQIPYYQAPREVYGMPLAGLTGLLGGQALYTGTQYDRER